MGRPRQLDRAHPCPPTGWGVRPGELRCREDKAMVLWVFQGMLHVLKGVVLGEGMLKGSCMSQETEQEALSKKRQEVEQYRARSASSLQNVNISTFSNWCTRIIPRVSLP